MFERRFFLREKTNRQWSQTDIAQLATWAGMSRGAVVYDSSVDPFTDDALFEKVRGRANVALVAVTSDGDVFGGFYSVAVTQHKQAFFDPNMFAFSFESHGRCMTPQRFVVKGECRSSACVKFLANDENGWFVMFGDGHTFSFGLGNEESNTWCHHLSGCFEGIEDTTLTGKTWQSSQCRNYHCCCRLVTTHLS